MPDHVHLFLEVDQTFAPSVTIKRVKGRASHHLRKEFLRLLKLPTLGHILGFTASEKLLLKLRNLVKFLVNFLPF
jgi:REP element-mobilizing transposase RayT